MAYRNFEEPVYTEDELAETRALIARNMVELEARLAFWQKALAEATFSDTRNEQSYPEFYYVADDVFEFQLVTDNFVAYSKVGDPFCKRLFDKDMEVFDVGSRAWSSYARQHNQKQEV